MELLNIVKDLIKSMVGHYVDSAKDQVHSLFKRLYSFFLISLFCITMFCFSIAALTVSLAQKLDEVSFCWMKSMTLYSVVALFSVGILYYTNKHYIFCEPTVDDEIDIVIRKHNRKNTKQRKTIKQ